MNGHCHIVCNPLYTAYFTTAAKDRLTIIDVLTNHRPRRFLVNAEALGYLEALGLSTVRHRQAGQLPCVVCDHHGLWCPGRADCKDTG
jgi:hypothetical protein